MTTTAWAHLPNAKHIDDVIALDAARDAARDAAWDAAWDAARDAAWDAACGAIYALVAWDDAGELLNKPLAHVEGMRALGDYAATLLYPYMVVKSHGIKEVA